MRSNTLAGCVRTFRRTAAGWQPRSTLQQIRPTARERMAEGNSPADVAASFVLHRGWAYKMPAKARARGKHTLFSSQRSRRPRLLQRAQERQAFRRINSNSRRQYGIDFELWADPIVGEHISHRIAVQPTPASVRALLARLELPAHKSRAVREYLDSLIDEPKLRLHPPFAPDVNLDKLVSSYTKRKIVARSPPGRNEKLADRVLAQTLDIKSRPLLARSFFKHQSIAGIPYQ